MLVYKAQQVVACVKEEPKPWKMEGREGVTHSAKLAVIGVNAEAASIRLKAKSADELAAKVAKYTVGKPAEIAVVEVIPVFRSGDRRAASYELVA